MNHADDSRTEDQELSVRVGSVTRIEQIALGRITERIVDVLTRAVDTGEGLLVQQADHSVFFGYALQYDHRHLLMVGREVAVLEHGSELELAGCNLVMTGLRRNPELEEFAFSFEHECQDAFG